MNADETISWIKEQLSNDTPLRAMYQAKKSDIMVMWAKSLEKKIQEGSLSIPITGISNYIRKELIELELHSAVHIMYHALPPKFKSITPPQYEDVILENSNENSSTPKDYSLENHTLLDVTKKIRTCIDTLQEILEVQAVQTNCEKKYLDEVVKMSVAVAEKAKFCTDGREKVSKLDHVLSLQLATSCTLNSIYETLSAQKMKEATITSKQMGKIVGLKIKDAYATLRPTTEQQAIQQGWSGIACDECGEYRVTRDYNSNSENFMDHCVTCDNWQKMSLSPVIKNRPL